MCYNGKLARPGRQRAAEIVVELVTPPFLFRTTYKNYIIRAKQVNAPSVFFNNLKLFAVFIISPMVNMNNLLTVILLNNRILKMVC